MIAARSVLKLLLVNRIRPRPRTSRRRPPILSLLLPERPRAQALALCSALLLVSLAFIGHAAMHEGTLGALHRANHAVHLLAAGYWFGSLAPLLVCLRYLQPPQWRSDAITTLIRFSRWGHLAVAAVIVTGIVNSLIILGGWPLNLGSPYQRLLLIKTALVALMVMVALANRYAIVPAMSRVPALAQRYGARALPHLKAIDLRRDPPAKGRWLSPVLVEALAGRHLPVHAFDLTDVDKTEKFFDHEDVDAVATPASGLGPRRGGGVGARGRGPRGVAARQARRARRAGGGQRD